MALTPDTSEVQESGLEAANTRQTIGRPRFTNPPVSFSFPPALVTADLAVDLDDVPFPQRQLPHVPRRKVIPGHRCADHPWSKHCKAGEPWDCAQSSSTSHFTDSFVKLLINGARWRGEGEEKVT